MANYQIDLHTHTTASDGKYTPSQVVERAARRGVRVLGIADHDTVSGVAEAQAAGRQQGIEVVAAIELSTRQERAKNFVGIHLLGYFLNLESPALLDTLAKVQQGRLDQKIKQIEKLRSFGFDVPTDEVLALANGVPGRPHIVKVLLERNPGKFESVQQIYDEYLGTNARAYVPRQFSLTVAEAVAVVKEAGGLPVFAHPGAYDADIDPIIAVRNAKAAGVEGVEVFYPYDSGHRPTVEEGAGEEASWVARIDTLAAELGLLKTGGTDFHGRAEDEVDLGDMGLTEEQFAALQQGWQRLRRKPD